MLPLGDLSPGMSNSSQRMIEETLAGFNFFHLFLFIHATGHWNPDFEGDEKALSAETLRDRARILLVEALREKNPNAEFTGGGLKAVWRSDDVLVLTYEIQFSQAGRKVDPNPPSYFDQLQEVLET